MNDIIFAQMIVGNKIIMIKSHLLLLKTHLHLLQANEFTEVIKVLKTPKLTWKWW